MLTLSAIQKIYNFVHNNYCRHCLCVFDYQSYNFKKVEDITIFVFFLLNQGANIFISIFEKNEKFPIFERSNIIKSLKNQLTFEISV